MNKQDNRTDSQTSGSDDTVDDPRQQAIKLKTFQHFFSIRDMRKGITRKSVLKKLKTSKELESSATKYIKALADDPTIKIVFPWDSFLRRSLFWLGYWFPRVIKRCAIAIIVLLAINYVPGPSQHIIELLIVRAIYDTAPVSRLPDTLETYAHSANIVDSNGAILKSYGKRKVTAKMPESARKAIMACEDHYFLPHPKNPWYVNAFLIHPGVSWFNLAGAVKDTLRGRTRGASTLVMQNAKKILGNEKRSIMNKLEEIVVSYVMVTKFGKEGCLDFYINTVPVGSNIYGFQSAAQNYFRKELSELNYQQLVAIGSFIPNHNRKLAFYDIVLKGKSFEQLTPGRLFHAKSAINKINLALAYLRDREDISAEEFDNWHLDSEESLRRIGFRDFSSPLYGKEEWTAWNVIREVSARSYYVDDRKISGSKLILDAKGDVTIETGVDVDVVDKIKVIINEYLASTEFKEILRKKNKRIWKKDLNFYLKNNIPAPYTDFDGYMEYLYKHINVGVVAINRQGEIISYIGGKEFWKGGSSNPSESEGSRPTKIIIDLMNTKAKFAPSSTIKPIISYYTMVTENSGLNTTYPDTPVEYRYVESAGKKLWMPRNWYNYNKKGEGRNRYLGRKYSLLEAQVVSINTIFARLYSNRRIRDAILLGFDDIDLDYNREKAKYWPFGIGSSDLPVQQWLGVYNAFLDGKYREPSFVKRILINGSPIYERDSDPKYRRIDLFKSDKERQQEMMALHEVCDRGTASGMKSEFKYYKKLVSGKTGTAPHSRSALFISHFNPYQNRHEHPEKTLTMFVAITTDSSGMKSVGASGDAPVKIAGRIYNYLFDKEMRHAMNDVIENAKQNNAELRNNYVFMANVNRYFDQLLNGKCGKKNLYENIIGVDGYKEALGQILNKNNAIYTGKDNLFGKLVEYYCDGDKLFKNIAAPINIVPLNLKKKVH